MVHPMKYYSVVKRTQLLILKGSICHVYVCEKAITTKVHISFYILHFMGENKPSRCIINAISGKYLNGGILDFSFFLF